MSTTGYAPIDPSAISLFSKTQTVNWLAVAFLTLLLYDHLITLDKEVEWIWTLRWRLPKVIFIVNRYIISSLILLYGISSFMFPVTLPFCRFFGQLYLYLPVLNFGTAELLIIVRVCALYGHSKLVTRSLGVCFLPFSKLPLLVLYCPKLWWQMSGIHFYTMSFYQVVGCGPTVRVAQGLNGPCGSPLSWLKVFS